MCDQIPDEIILNDRRIAIDPLPICENDSVAYSPEEALQSTAEARGYVAYWSLVGGKLFLVETKGCYIIYEMGLIFADWVNATIRPASGSYGENFSIHIKDGVVVS